MEETQRLYRYTAISLLSCLYTVAVYYCVEVSAKRKGPKVFQEKTNNSFSRLQKMLYLFGMKARSNSHCTTTFLLAVCSLCYGGDMYQDHLRGRSEIATITCSISIGYMIGDQLINFIYWKELGEMQYLIHHIWVVSACVYLVVTGEFHIFAMVRFLCEGSNLFVNTRNVLHKLGFHRTFEITYYYASVAMLVSFLLCRIVTMPLLLYLTITVSGSDGAGKASVAGQTVLWTGHIILDSLNLRWFSKIVKSVRRLETWGDTSMTNGGTKCPSFTESFQVY